MSSGDAFSSDDDQEQIPSPTYSPPSSPDTPQDSQTPSYSPPESPLSEYDPHNDHHPSHAPAPASQTRAPAQEEPVTATFTLPSTSLQLGHTSNDEFDYFLETLVDKVYHIICTRDLPFAVDDVRAVCLNLLVTLGPDGWWDMQRLFDVVVSTLLDSQSRPPSAPDTPD